MDSSHLRAWWAHRQGLDGSLDGASPAKVLERVGWARSVGGANPYLTLFARAGTSQKASEEAVKRLQIHELPSARGCTYFLPASEFALGLTVGQGFSEQSAINTAKKHLGYTEKEHDKLCAAVLKVLGDKPMDPRAIKDAVGGAVRSFGDEGKKRGQTTSLPLALGFLQSHGEIRRVPLDERLDQQHYAYVNWKDSPLKKSKIEIEEAYTRLAAKYWSWIGPATMAQFQWFSGLGVKAAKDAVAPLKLVALGEGFLIHAKDLDAFKKFRAPKSPQYALTADLDSIVLLGRSIQHLVDAKDLKRKAFGEKGARELSSFSDMPHHLILDRGQVVGFWEYEVSSGSIVWKAFGKPDPAMKKAVKRMEDFVRTLGDARSFSLDSPESRQPRVDSLK